MMERMAEGAIELNDNEVFHNCSYSCYANLADALNMLRDYEDTGLTPEQVQELKEKQTPKKPIVTSKGEEEYSGCPVCNKFVFDDYCQCCGQAIDWE